MAGTGNDLVREARRRAALTQADLAPPWPAPPRVPSRASRRARTTPSFDTVLRLVRLCGFDLDVALVERDGSDWAQARRLLPLSPAERLARAERVARELRRLTGRPSPPRTSTSLPKPAP